MLNKFLILMHWILYGLVVLSIFSIVLESIKSGYIDAKTQDIFRYSVVALAFFISMVWMIKRRWIYFPWQHNKK
jgi:hypothetical protein